MPGNRPAGREKNVAEGTAKVKKRGEGTGLGSVGGSQGYGGKTSQSAGNTGGGASRPSSSGSFGAGRPSSGSTGSSSYGSGRPSSFGVGGSSSQGAGGTGSGSNRGSGGKKGSPLMLIILLAVVLLGGGGGLGALFGGGGSGGSGNSTSTLSNSGSTSSGSATSGTSSSYGLGSSSSGNSSYGSFQSGTGSSHGSYSSSGYNSSSTPGLDLSDLGSLLGELGLGTYDDSSSYGTLSDLFGTGSGSGSSSSGSYGSYGSSGSGSSGSYGSSGSSSSGSYGSFGSGSGSASGTYGSFGSGSGSSSSSGYGGLDYLDLSSIFGSGLSQSAGGISGGWADGNGGNIGVLNTSVSPKARSKYTTLKGKGKDTATIMIFMCGTDLESRSGMATADLTEMAAADIADNVNVLVYTGGCTRWNNNIVSSSANQIYQVRSGGLERLVDNDGDRTMTDPATLTRFIRWGAQNFPATRNQLIFWDHGGGSVSGFGYDQKHQSSGSMNLAQISKAIADSGVKFDFIGFDACLMATVENALALSPYADYLLASEETEPGMGWYYTNWLTELSRNTSLPTTQLGKMIIDDFVDVSAKKCKGQPTTLSLVDLSELQATLPKAFTAFASDISTLLDNSEYKTVATARNDAREFAPSTRIDQVDLVNLAQELGTEEGSDLTDVLLSAVKYNRTSKDMANSYGLSIYFPKAKLSQVDTMVRTYRSLGMDETYTRCIQQYAAVSASGQAASGGGASGYSLIDMLLGGSTGSSSSSGSYGSFSGGSSSGSSSSQSGYGTYSTSGGGDFLMQVVGSLLGGRSFNIAGLDDSNTLFLSGSGMNEEQIVQNLTDTMFNTNYLTWETSGDHHTMWLPQSQWDLVAGLDMQVFYNDGEGLIELGTDNLFNFDDTGALIGEMDGTWLTLDGNLTAYYHISSIKEGNGYTTIGRIPALLNGDRVDLIVVFDQEQPNGYIAGARRDYREGETDTLAKTMTSIQEGDTIDFLCDYYSYDGTVLDSYYLGDTYTWQGEPKIANMQLEEGELLVSYRFTDLYGQQYWTEPITM